MPYIVAVAIVKGDCGPGAFGEDLRGSPQVRRLMKRVKVIGSEEFDARVSLKRGAKVSVALRDGSCLSAEVPNAVGDVDHRPFGLKEINQKVDDLLRSVGTGAGEAEHLVRELLAADDVNDVLKNLAWA